MRTHLQLLALLASLALAGCAADSPAAPELVEFRGATMGTTWLVKLPALPSGHTREQIQAEIERRLETVSGQMSTYRPDSELSRFNAYDGTDWFPVSADTARVVSAALQVSEASGGAFDVTVGPLVNLWDFGPEHRDARLPSDEELAAARARVGYRMLEVRPEPPALRKSDPAVYVDLSAIAKGFGVDAIVEYLGSIGCESYFAEIGGEIRARGTKPDGSGWKIGIEAPASDRFSPRAAQRIVTLDGQAVATSGDYRNYWELQGRRFSHTIDPRTGRPVEHRLASVSVLAGDCMSADAWATTLMVLGPDDAYNLAVEKNLAVLLIIREDDGFVERSTPGFPER